MGSWNGTCAISNLHILSGQRVAIFMLTRNARPDNYCYNNTFYNPVLLPFYGEYDDYGSAENCYGSGMPIILDAIKSKLTELEQGPNEYHDPEAKSETFDISTLFNLDHEDRLYIKGDIDIPWLKSWTKSRLEKGDDVPAATFASEVLEKIKLGTRCTHILIHGDIFDDIINKWQQTDYRSDNTKRGGYRYLKYKFADVVASIPEYLSVLREKTKKLDIPGLRLRSAVLSMRGGLFPYDTTNLAGKWLQPDSSDRNGLIDLHELIVEASEHLDDEEMTELLTDLLKGRWINAFMAFSRKPWLKQIGSGSQNQEHDPYRLLIRSMAGVLKKEKEEWDE